MSTNSPSISKDQIDELLTELFDSVTLLKQARHALDNYLCEGWSSISEANHESPGYQDQIHSGCFKYRPVLKAALRVQVAVADPEDDEKRPGGEDGNRLSLINFEQLSDKPHVVAKPVPENSAQKDAGKNDDEEEEEEEGEGSASTLRQRKGPFVPSSATSSASSTSTSTSSASLLSSPLTPESATSPASVVDDAIKPAPEPSPYKTSESAVFDSRQARLHWFTTFPSAALLTATKSFTDATETAVGPLLRAQERVLAALTALEAAGVRLSAS